MKKILWLPALFLLTLFAACKKDSNNTTATPANSNAVSFTTSKSFNGSTSIVFKSIDSNNELFYSRQTSSPVASSFQGTQTTTSGGTTITTSLYLYVPGATTGTVRFEDGNYFRLTTTVGQTTQSYYQMTSGTMQINTLTDKEIGGIFSGKAVGSSDSFNITSGVFYYKF